MKHTLLLLLLTVCLCCRCTPHDTEPAIRNVIFMIGDGMGLAQVTALSAEGDYAPIPFDRAEVIGLQKTYSANNRVTDSAAAGTALATGSKTDNGTIGLAPDGSPLESALQVAASHYNATGIVVTYSPLDATPAAFVAHTADRYDFEGTALQYVTCGVDVIAGSGPQYFNRRSDGRDLIAEMEARGYTFAADKAALLGATHTPLLALLPDESLPYAVDDSLNLRGDYLAEATAKAIALLEASGKKGFFLMVEGSLIDKAAHRNDYEGMMAEMRDFSRAVDVACAYADAHPGTLVVVTGDHETGGLSLLSPDPDFVTGNNGLVGRFATDSHSGTFVPVYAYGTGAERFGGMMENSDLGNRLKQIAAGTR